MIEASVRDKFYDPSFDEIAWRSIVERHRPEILEADGTDGFEQAVSRLLAAFSPGTSLGLLSARTAITPRNAINASFASVTIEGEPRWVFQDVLPTGLADKAGACPGDVVLEVDGAPVSPSESGKGGPTFAMGKGFAVTVQRGAAQTKRTLSFLTPHPQYKDNPYAGLTPISYKKLGEGIDHFRIGIFQGKVASTSQTISINCSNDGSAIRGTHHRSARQPRRGDRGPRVDERPDAGPTPRQV